MSRVLELNPDHVNAAFARAACYNAVGLFTKAIEDYNFALMKDESGSGARQSVGMSAFNDRSGAGTPIGIEVHHSFTHDDSKSPLPWLSPSGIDSGAKSSPSSNNGYTSGNDASTAAARSPSPSPMHRTVSNDSDTTNSLSHRLSNAIRPHATAPVSAFSAMNSPGQTPMDNSVISRDKKDIAETEYALGYRCRKQGNFKQAIVHYTNAISADPQSFKSIFNRGFAYDKLEDFDSAIRDYSAAAAIEPDNAFAYYNRGITQDRSGNISAACSDFAKAISIQPRNVDFLHNYGNCLRKLEKYDAAVGVYSKVLELSPKGGVFKAYFNRGVCLEKLEQMDGALLDYNQALHLQPKHLQALINRANVLLVKNKLDDSLVDLEAAKTAGSMTMKQRVLMATIKANILEKQGNLREALKEIESALHLEAKTTHFGDSDTTLLFSTRANIYKSMEEYNKAISDLTSALQMNPPNPSTCYSIRGFCWRKLGNFEEAASDYGRCIEHHMTVFNALSNSEPAATKESSLMGARHYNNRAYCYAKLGRYQEAVSDYSAAIQLDPSNSHAYHNRGTSYDKMGKGDLAIADFSKVLELDSPDRHTVISGTSSNIGQANTTQHNYSSHGTFNNFSPMGAHAGTPSNSASSRYPQVSSRKVTVTSPDRSVSTIGDCSVSGGAHYNHVNYSGTLKTAQPIALSQPYTSGDTPARAMSPSAASRESRQIKPTESFSDSPARKNVTENSGGSSKFQNWNAARVNNALESAKLVAATPTENNMWIRSVSPSPLQRNSTPDRSGNVVERGINLKNTTPSGRPGSAPPVRSSTTFPVNYRYPSPNARNYISHSSVNTGIAIGTASAPGRSVSPRVNIEAHTSIAANSSRHAAWAQPKNAIGDADQNASRTSPLHSGRSASSARPSRDQPQSIATTRSHSPRIPLRINPSATQSLNPTAGAAREFNRPSDRVVVGIGSTKEYIGAPLQQPNVKFSRDYRY